MSTHLEHGAEPVDVRFISPRVPAGYVERPRLTLRLNQAVAEQPLTLISAPAGSGKTTLAAAWSSGHSLPGRVAWITFEADDQEAGAFWSSVEACLSRFGATALDRPRGGGRRRMLTELCAGVTKFSEPLTLILDGLEVVDSTLGDDIAWMLRHTGRMLRLVLLSRSDPLLPLQQLRLADEVVEIRLADLAFTLDEAARLVETAGTNLGPESVQTLLDRTRGWAVGLRFAAMRLADAPDPDRAVQELIGDSGNVAEYLMSEILATLPPADRELLLRTSVVDVLRPGLTEVLGGRAAARRLTRLARANVLVDELTGQPGWFRYHPFLKELLRAELAFLSPRLTRRLRREAARWYAETGMLDDAVSHAAASGWWADASAYAVGGLAVAELIVGDETGVVGRSLRGLPDHVSGADAAAVRAALVLSRGDVAGCDAELLHVQRAREARKDAGSGNRSRGTDHAEAALELVVAAVTTSRDCSYDRPGAVRSTRRHLDRLATWHHPERPGRRALVALAHTALGTAQLRAGDIVASGETFVSAAAAAEDAGSVLLQVRALAHLSLIAALEGRLGRAWDLASRSRSVAEAHGVDPGLRTPHADLALAWVCAERNDLETGQRHLDEAVRWCSGDRLTVGLAAVVRSRMLRSVGDSSRARVVVEQAQVELDATLPWLAELLAVEAVRSLVAQGRSDSALAALAGPRNATPEELVVKGHAQLQRLDWTALGGTLERLAHPDGFVPVDLRVEALVLRVAHALHRGEGHRARTTLRQALEIAARETMRRPFREAPVPVREALMSDAQLLKEHAWLGIKRDAHAADHAVRWRSPGFAPESDAGQIIEPLTPKENEVLSLLAELLTTEEIAATMIVSVNTVRTHIRSILRKLAVSRRNDAVRRARALSLLVG